MNPIEATQSVLIGFAEFSGRATRSEYWWFVAVWTVVYLLLIGIQRNKSKLPEVLFIAITFVPVMSVSFRRLQDAGFSGWWSVAELVVLCAIVGVLYVSAPSETAEASQPENALGKTFLISSVLFIVATIGIIWHFSLPSDPGPNEYGPNPHEVTS